MRTRGMIGLAALLLSGCFTRIIAEKMGVSGWFRADRIPLDHADYKGRFERLPLSGEFDCAELQKRQGDGSKPTIVLIHGVGGDGSEMEEAVPTLSDSHPASIYMFRWVPYDSRDEISARLAKGISRIAECLPDARGKILVIAHSAGGVISGFAASQVKVADPTGAPTVVWLTVASPLAGTVRRAGNEGGREESTVMLDLGTRIKTYPAAAPGVRVVHLRTKAPADSVMTPTGDLLPNDPTVGVPGAAQIDLPEGLSHSGALEYVAKEVAAGRWNQW